jgi:hypothetical protein
VVRNIFIAVLALVFSSMSTTIAEMAMFALHAVCGGDRPRSDWVSQGGIVLIGLGFVVILFLRAQTAVRTGEPTAMKEVATYAALGTAGGLFAILKVWFETSRDGKPLDWSPIGAIFMLLIVVLVFLAAGFMMSRLGKEGASEFSKFTYRVTVAALIAGGAGIAVQVANLGFGAWMGFGITAAECSEKHLPGLFRFGTTSFFISAPMTAFLFAIYAGAAAIAASTLRAGSARRTLIVVGSLFGGALLSSIYALMLYDHGWPPVYRVYVFLMLQLPAVCGAILVSIFTKQGARLFWCAVVGLVGFICALLVAWPFISIVQNESMTTGRALMFALAHAVTAFFTVFGVDYAMRAKLLPTATNTGKP